MEECPSPLVALHPEMRQAMGEAAVRAAARRRLLQRRHGGVPGGPRPPLLLPGNEYAPAGGASRHRAGHRPRPGAAAGRDRRRRAAAASTQEEVPWRGSAIECRIYAEDPYNDFLPSPGKLTRLTRPLGPGIRLDGCVYDGWTVPMEYDPLLAKLAVWAAHARGGHRPHDPRAARIRRGRHPHQHRLLPPDSGRPRIPRRPPAHRLHRGILRARIRAPGRRADLPRRGRAGRRAACHARSDCRAAPRRRMPARAAGSKPAGASCCDEARPHHRRRAEEHIESSRPRPTAASASGDGRERAAHVETPGAGRLFRAAGWPQSTKRAWKRRPPARWSW